MATQDEYEQQHKAHFILDKLLLRNYMCTDNINADAVLRISWEEALMLFITSHEIITRTVRVHVRRGDAWFHMGEDILSSQL